MKKFILGITFIICGVIGFIGIINACTEIGGWNSIKTNVSQNGGIFLLVIFTFLFIIGLVLSIYTIVLENKHKK